MGQPARVTAGAGGASPAKKAAAKKAPAKKAPAKKVAAEQTPAKKAAAKKTPPKKAAKKATKAHPHKGTPRSRPRRGAAADGSAADPTMGLPSLPAPPTDPVQILGLERDFTAAQLRQAWRRYAAQHHPDQGGDAATFDRGRAAYETLRGCPR